MKFLCEQCKAKYQIADEKAAGKTVRMKCRKCGYLIEVRAAVTETSTAGAGSDSAEGQGRSSSRPPTGSPAPPGTGPSAPKAQKPAPPRASPLATSLASAKSPQPKTDVSAGSRSTSGALAGAFKSTVQRDEETSAPFDMADLSPNDEWYVAINGVPVGPIRIGEVRRKAALGAVTEDSLCWQEGMDEWRALRSFPELVAIVREAFSSGRSSLPPPPGAEQARPSTPPPQQQQQQRASAKPPSPAGPARPPARPSPAAPAARSNVVPITSAMGGQASRLATAEKLEESPDDHTRPYTGPPITADRPAPTAKEPSIVPDPFAAPPAAAALAGPSAPAAIASSSGQPVLAPMTLTPEAAVAAAQAALPQRKQPNWPAIAMVAAAVAFGVTTPIAIFVGRSPAPAPVVVQVPASPAQPTASAAAMATAPAATDSSTPTETTPTPTAKGPVAMGGPSRGGNPSAPAAPTAGRGPLDLHGLTGNSVSPVDEPGSGAAAAPGQCFSSGQVQQVIGLHKPGISRSCWERNPTTKLAVNVSVNLTIGPDGSPQAVSASADEPSIAKCVENDVRAWRFPAMGCTQPTNFSLHFVKQ